MAAFSADDSPPAQPPAGAGGQLGLNSGSFLALLVTQALTATNDNIFRWLAIGLGKQYVEPSHVGMVLMAGTACFVLPYLFLAAPAGYLADRFSKRSVIVACKAAEVVIMLAGIAAILAGSLGWIIAVVACMGAQSALFSPSKLGSIPEMLKPESISTANGLLGLTTVMAVVVGTGAGNVLSDLLRPEVPGAPPHSWWVAAVVLLGVAGAGWLASLAIVWLPAADPTRRLPWDAVAQTIRDLRTLAASRALFRVALGIAFFWSLGTLANLNIDQFGFEGGVMRQTEIVPLLIALTVGVGLGSVLAGVWSGGHVELGILPLGAGGVALFSLLLFQVHGELIDPQADWTASYVLACVLLFLLGTSAGLFDVPLNAYLQHRSPPAARGAILAASNFVTFTGILLASLLFAGLRAPLQKGNLDQVERLRERSLSETQRQRVAEAADRFEQQWQAGREPPLAPVLAGLDGDMHAALLARLLWIDIHERQRCGAEIDVQSYRRQFATQRALVDEVASRALGRPLFSARYIFLLCGLFTIPVFLYIVLLIPQASLRFLVWLASKTAYRIRVYGRENLPARGGALLASNHVSWLDGILLMLTSSRPIRMLVYAGNFRQGWLVRLARMWGAILIDSGPKSIARALQAARQALQDGELVCIFPEGGITRSGQLQGFRPGLLKIIQGTGVPVIPVYLDELWGSIFSFEGGKFFWKLPRRWRYPISIHFGRPVADAEDLYRVRQAVGALGAQAVEQRSARQPSLTRLALRICKRRRWRSKVADASGENLSGGSLLTRALLARRLLRRHALAPDERNVGVLLPPAVGAVVTNLALTLDRRVAINLNYSLTAEVLNDCIAQAGIRHVLTSRRFAERIKSVRGLDVNELQTELVYLEDLRPRVRLGDKLAGALATQLVPTAVLHRALGLHRVKPDELMTIIFTSGSTGRPKGVMLSYANIMHNVLAVQQVFRLTPADVLVGVLPFFHSFGYTITLWAIAALDVKGIYHFDPLDARQIGKLCQAHGATILVATPTFLRAYLRRCTHAQLATLDSVIVGAEKLPAALADSFEQHFGVRPVEGYGATELSPLVSVNLPPSRSVGEFQVSCKEGTVGRPVPGVTAKIVDRETGDELSADQPGMLWIKGPNVMRGYLNQPEKTAEVVRDGWYVTGDIAAIDEDGFLRITGRESRFSKIAGEMVPHVAIEEALNEIISGGEDHELKAVVTAVPDEKKGERLVVVHLPMTQTAETLRQELQQRGFPNLYLPSADSFLQVDELPLLGSGKVDLKRVQQLALDSYAG